MYISLSLSLLHHARQRAAGALPPWPSLIAITIAITITITIFTITTVTITMFNSIIITTTIAIAIAITMNTLLLLPLHRYYRGALPLGHLAHVGHGSLV